MSRLSIFSFDTLQFKYKNVLTKTAALALIGLIFVEVAIRTIIPAGQIPTGSWYNHTIRLQYEELQKLQDVDIFFIGTSISCVNIPPQVFDEELAQAGVNKISFNAGIAGPDYEGVSAALRHLYWPQKQAKTAIVVVAPNDLNTANPVVRERTQKYIHSFERPVFASLAVDFLSKFWLFGFRKELKEWLKNDWKFDKAVVGAKGFTPLPNKQRSRHKTSYRIEPEGRISQSFVELLLWLNDQNVRAILVRGLTKPAEKKLISAEQWQNFEKVLQRAEALPGVESIDVSSIEAAAEDFVDPLHIHQEAAHNYAKKLAQLFIEQNVLKK
ncbi:MAG: hypothetical protein H6696_06850 [Deferribacteres bacterium]|nr:hypothetical protein [candidate division KSB1 bacterium]MCB9501640.1 hypothetical protein [Deferribacteres bacterium]